MDDYIVLHYAARNGSADAVRLLLRYADSRDTDGETALHTAAANGHLAVARILLENTPSLIWAKNRYGTTPLLRAVRNGHRSVCKLLIESKWVKNDLGEDAYKRCCFNNWSSPAFQNVDLFYSTIGKRTLVTPKFKAFRHKMNIVSDIFPLALLSRL